uniref:Phage-like element PBSX protein, XkdF n=1 Tax=uncultured Caudovirales phage TaxID=2100421 RepID=A0A6J7X2H7_9CAUD|nr:Phage-like element PBSX protein, XkdF [uncultured Caudovirales phage]
MIKDNIEELYELILQDDEDGVFANSLVESPAIERDFVWLNKEVAFQSVSDEKQLVAGPILVPNKKILRIDGEGKRYSVFFTPETIEMVARKFMKNKYGDEVTLEHGAKTAGVYLTESWIIEQSAKDKSNIFGFTLPRGTWFGVYKVDDKKIWDKVKDGTFRGFSIEGLFEHRKSNLKLSLEKQINDLTEDEAKELLNTIHQMLMPTISLEGAQPSITSTYPGQIAKKKNDDK